MFWHHWKWVAVQSVLLLLVASCSRQAAQQSYIESLKRFSSANDAVLVDYAEKVLRGEVDRVEPFVYHAPPLITNSDVSVLGVTTDANHNVYFILKDSFTTFNVGVIYNARGKPFLGDQIEPRLATNIHLHGAWYYYKGI